jgi:glycosyltransferase involved in cell wall biosynthesis
MLEWVLPEHFNSGFYNYFDEVWCLNKNTYSVFKDKYKNSKDIFWQFYDDNLFYKENKYDKITYYHQASLNKNASTKNTEKVIEAFIDANKYENLNAQLIITGLHADTFNGNLLQKDIENHANIKIYNSVIKREEVASIMRKSHVLVAPSSKEGLAMMLYEATACDCKIITTDAAPMNSFNEAYLCKPSSVKLEGLNKSALIEKNEILRNIIKSYKDLAL